MKNINNIENKFPWSFVGVVIGVISICLALAIYLIGETNRMPDLQVKVDSVEKLVDIREQMQDLKILYKGRDILNTNEEIMILNITLINNGADILNQMYDQNQPFGLSFPGASILSFKIVTANSQYLLDNLNPAMEKEPSGTESDSNNKSEKSLENITSNLVFTKPIFERNKYVKLKIYLLQERGTDIKIEPFGKIAGIDKIPVVIQSVEKETNWRTAFLSSILGIFGILITLIAFIARFRKVRRHETEEIMQIFKHEISTKLAATEYSNKKIEEYLEKVQETQKRANTVLENKKNSTDIVNEREKPNKANSADAKKPRG